MLGYSVFLLEARRLIAEADGTPLRHEGNPHDKVKWSLQLRNQTKGKRILKADGSLISDGNQTFHGLKPILHFSFADHSPKNHYDAQFIYPLCMISSVPDSKQQSWLWREEQKHMLTKAPYFLMKTGLLMTVAPFKLVGWDTKQNKNTLSAWLRIWKIDKNTFLECYEVKKAC